MKVEVIIRAKQDVIDAKPAIHLRKISSSMTHAIKEIKSIYKNYEFVRISFYRNDDGSFIKTLYFRYGQISKI